MIFQEQGHDTFFNFALIKDEVLKQAYFNSNGNLMSNHTIADNISRLCDDSNWIRSEDLSEFWGIK
jgi:hypothetical protein